MGHDINLVASLIFTEQTSRSIQRNRNKCTGLSRENKMDRSVIGHIRLGFIDLGECIRVRRDREESGYRQWLSDELERIRQELGEDVFPLDGDPYS